MVRGTVAFFDEPRGLGQISTDDGVTVGFHCTAIANGTRTIPERVAVRYDIVPGRHGLWEADRVEIVS